MPRERSSVAERTELVLWDRAVALSGSVQGYCPCSHRSTPGSHKTHFAFGQANIPEIPRILRSSSVDCKDEKEGDGCVASRGVKRNAHRFLIGRRRRKEITWKT